MWAGGDVEGLLCIAVSEWCDRIGGAVLQLAILEAKDHVIESDAPFCAK